MPTPIPIPRPVTRGQRVLLLAGLALTAVSLHVVLCDWHWRYRESLMNGEGRRIVAIERSSTYNHPVFGGARPHTMGLYAANQHRAVATLAGVVLPVLIVGSGAYLILGWRHDDRVRRGLCVHCGYDRHGASGPCPECGTPTPRR